MQSSNADAEGLRKLIGDVLDRADGEAAACADSPNGNEARGPDSPSTADEPDEAPPPQIEGYEVIRTLSRGGQGVVYESLQKATKRRVAVKVLLAGPHASQAARRRFEREIELVAQLSHPGIITVFDSGTTPDGHRFHVMDYVRGKPLHEHVRAKQLTLAQTLELMAAVCDAVQYAHQRGVIHRDLKPANILVDADGQPKILDFGLAKQLTEPVVTLVTLSHQVIGTLPYMSPEQAGENPDEVDTRTDVYALGVILFELLTGRHPYPVTGRIPDALRHITETPPTPPTRAWSSEAGIIRHGRQRLRPDKCPIDREVETIMLKALAKQRDRRYQSAGELARDLRHYLAGEPIQARRDSARYVIWKTLGRYRFAVGVAAAFVLILVGSVVGLSALYSRAEQSRELAELRATEAEDERALASTATHRLARVLYARNLEVAFSSIQLGDMWRAVGHLEDCKPEFPGWEWRYLAGLLDQSSECVGHFPGVRCAAWSPDGEYVMAGGNDVRFWRRVREQWVEVQEMAQPARHWPAAWTRDGRYAVSAEGTDRLIVWNPATGQVAADTRTTGRGITALACGATFVVFGDKDGKVGVWHFGQNQEPHIWTAHEGPICAVAVNPNGDRFLSASGSWITSRRGDGFIRMWDVGSGEPLATMSIPPEDITHSLCFMREDNRFIATTDNGQIRMGDMRSQDWLHVWPGHERRIRSCALSPDGKLLVTACENTIRMWSMEPFSDQPLETLHGSRYVTHSIAWSPDGERFVTSSQDDTVRVWNRDARSPCQRFALGAPISHAAFSSDGRLLATFDEIIDGRFVPRIRDSNTAELLSELRSHEARGAGIAFSSDARLIATAAVDGSVRVWDWNRSTLLWKKAGVGVPDHANRTHSLPVAFDPAGDRLTTGGIDGVLRVWRVHDGALLSEHRLDSEGIADVVWSPCGRLIAAAGIRLSKSEKPCSVWVWDVEHLDPPRRLRGHTSEVFWVAFDETGKRLISGGEDTTLRVWDVVSSEMQLTLEGHEYDVRCATFSPDGTRILSGGCETTRIWNASDAVGLLTLDRHHPGAPTQAVSFDPAGTRAYAVNGDGTLIHWTAPSREQVSHDTDTPYYLRRRARPPARGASP